MPSQVHVERGNQIVAADTNEDYETVEYPISNREYPMSNDSAPAANAPPWRFSRRLSHFAESTVIPSTFFIPCSVFRGSISRLTQHSVNGYTKSINRHLLHLASLLAVVLCSHASVLQAQSSPPSDGQHVTKKPLDDHWQPLFDGKTLGRWKITNFGGEGDVSVKDGKIVMEMGSSLTGITYQGHLPKNDYEISLEASRLDGVDFFCALTFPVRDSFCTFIVGGWAGAVVGISSIDGKDASENETTRYIAFKTNKWYRLRVRVQQDQIQAWIDDARVVHVKMAGRRLTTRAEVDLSKPLGVASWETRAAIRNIRIRKLKSSGKKKN